MTPTCGVCGSPNTERVARPPGPWTFHHCQTCGVFFVDPMPSGDAIDDAGAVYDEMYYLHGPRDREDEREALSLRARTEQVRALEQALGRRGRFLDVGTGSGFALRAANDLGWDAEGVEPSGSAAEFARTRLGLRVRTGTLQDAAYADGAFDAVWLSHVVEHVPDPVSLLREVARVLAPGGMAMLAMPNAAGSPNAAINAVHRMRGRTDKFACGLAPPGHLWGFSARSLTTALEAAGLSAERVFTSGKGDPIWYPVFSWSEAGPRPLALRVLELAGRVTRRGSLLHCFARKPG